MDEKAVSVQDVFFAYRTDRGDGEITVRQALKGTTASIDRGSYCAVLGRNGSGKSTLGLLMDALLVPDDGRIVVLGNDVSDEEKLDGIRENCSYVFQNPDNQIVGTTVEEDVAFGPENLGIELPELRQRVDDALRFVGLSDLAPRQAASLSGGQKQKLAIAGALAMKPEVLILDESTSMLDPVSRDEFLQIVEKMNREEKITVITITHDMYEAARCSKIFVMEDGVITMSGTPGEIFSQTERIAAAGLELPPDIALVDSLLKLRGERMTPQMAEDEDAALETAVSLIKETARDRSIEIPELSMETYREDRRTVMTVDGLSYAYDRRDGDVLSGVSLDIKEGEILAIVGRSGCGKTTLITHLNGLIRPDSGSVVFFGRDGRVLMSSRRKDLQELRKHVGLVFQYPEYQLFGETVEQDVAYGLRMMKTDEDQIRSRVAEAVKAVGLQEDILGRSPFELSGGQKRRVALAGVLVMKPEILVLDEPAAGLDPAGRQEIFSIINGLRDNGTTIVLVSHNMDEAARYADRICCISGGRIVSDGRRDLLFGEEGRAGACGLRIPHLQQFSERIRRELAKDCPGILFGGMRRTAEEEAYSLLSSFRGGAHA